MKINGLPSSSVYNKPFLLRKTAVSEQTSNASQPIPLVAGLMRMVLVAFTVVCLGNVCRCTTSSGPGGTDFPNTRTAVVGKIINEDGTAGSSTIIHLIPVDYNPLRITQSILHDTTDNNGNFSLPVEGEGTFNLQAVHIANGTRLMVRTIAVREDRDTVQVGENMLDEPGTMIIDIPESATATGGYIYIIGSKFALPVEKGQKYVVLDSIPKGTVPAIYFTEAESEEPLSIIIEDSVAVSAGDTTLVAPKKGDRFLKLVLNTTVSGADVSEDVYNFPVAIRFSSLPVDMNEMAENGSDIVLTDSNMDILPFEIEIWDPQNGEALVWVRVDTIFGNTISQYLYLFWGSEQQEPVETGESVFDTAQGFSAVWHLNEGCIDATGNKYNGEKTDQVSDTIGILGGSQQFYGADSIVIPGLLNRPSTVTLSAWAKLDSTVEKGAEVVSIGDAVLIRMDDYWGEKGCQGSYFSYPDSVDTMTHAYLGSGQIFAETGWHFFTYIFDGENMIHAFYIDGEFCCEQKVTVPIHYGNIGKNIVIGYHGNGKEFWPFVGSIDEVRVADRVREASWIRLCYMNQRAEDRLLSIRP